MDGNELLARAWKPKKLCSMSSMSDFISTLHSQTLFRCKALLPFFSFHLSLCTSSLSSVQSSRSSRIGFPNTNLLAFSTHVRIFDIVAWSCISWLQRSTIIRRTAIWTCVHDMVFHLLVAEGRAETTQHGRQCHGGKKGLHGFANFSVTLSTFSSWQRLQECRRQVVNRIMKVLIFWGLTTKHLSTTRASKRKNTKKSLTPIALHLPTKRDVSQHFPSGLKTTTTTPRLAVQYQKLEVVQCPGHASVETPRRLVAWCSVRWKLITERIKSLQHIDI